MIRAKLAVTVGVFSLALMGAGQAWACMPASGPPLTAEQAAAQEAAFQSRLWTDAQTVLIATVTGSDIVDRTLSVSLAPSVMIKGEGSLPTQLMVSDATYNCRPGGMMGAGRVTVGEVYVVYRNADDDLVVHQDNLTDPATIAAWRAASARGE